MITSVVQIPNVEPAAILEITGFGWTRKGVAFAKYLTKWGKGCSFLCKAAGSTIKGMLEALRVLVCLKGKFVELVKDFSVNVWGGIAIAQDSGKISVPSAELNAFRSRYQSAIVENINVKSLSQEAIEIVNPTHASEYNITRQGCNCGDIYKNICKHQIAAQKHLLAVDWVTLEEFFTPPIPKNLAQLSDAEVFRLAEDARLSLGV